MNHQEAQEHLGRGVGYSVLIHLFFVLLAWYAMPALGTLLAPLGSHHSPDEPEVVTFHFQDIIADVSEESRVEKAPETPIQGRFNSQAADRVPGEADTPVPEGGVIGVENSIAGTGAERDFPGGEATVPTAAKTPPAGPNAATPGSGDGVRLEPEGSRTQVPPGMLDALPSSADELLTGRRAANPEKPGYGAQRSDAFKDAGALAFGEYAFSTRAWDFEPYWVNMRSKLKEAWRPPAAYMYGIIKSGWTVVRVVVHKDGTIGMPEILDSEGHESLHRACLAAMVGAAPFRPLPAGFPDKDLVVTVRFIYMPPSASAARDAP